MTKIIATSKERLITYLDYKGVSYVEFFKGTGIKRGFLDSDKLKGTISDVFLAKIIAFLPNLDLVWLITGNGDMETWSYDPAPKKSMAAESKATYKSKEAPDDDLSKIDVISSAVVKLFLKMSDMEEEIKELKARQKVTHH